MAPAKCSVQGTGTEGIHYDHLNLRGAVKAVLCPLILGVLQVSVKKLREQITKGVEGIGVICKKEKAKC